MKVTLATYPWAFETPGGGEIQLLKYEQYLPTAGVTPIRHDPWSNGLGSTDVVHFFSCMGGSVHFAHYIQSRKLPLVISASLWLTPETLGLYPVGEIRDHLLAADRIVTNSEIESDITATLLDIDRARFAAVANACDPEFLTPVSTGPFEQRFGLTKPFVLCVGNIEPRKNQLNLIAATQRLGIDLVLIGHVRNLAYADQCWAQADGSVHYLGPIDHQDPLLRSAYAACAAFCLPSTLETPGLAALEAAAAGCRLVITSEGSTREYFGDLAHYANPADVADIAAQIAAAMATPRDGTLSRHIADNYTWPAVIGSLTGVYRSLTAGT